MYREPGDRDSMGVGNLARAQLPPSGRHSVAKRASDIHETNTPAMIAAKGLDLLNPGVKLPRIQSSRQSHINSPAALSRQQSRQSDVRARDYLGRPRNQIQVSQRQIGQVDSISLQELAQLSPRSEAKKLAELKSRPRSIQRSGYMPL